MDLGFDETEEMVRVSARDFLRREAGPRLARSGDASDFWEQVAEMGWPGLAVPEQYGGAGMGLLALSVLIEQWGAQLGRGPLFETSVLVAPLIESAGDERLKREVLPQLADGSSTATVALLEQTASWRPEDIRATAVKTADGWAITGAKHFVSYGDKASRLLLAARTGDRPRDVSLFLVNRDSSGITSERLDHASGAPVSTLTFNETSISGDRLVGGVNAAAPLIESLFLRGAAFRALQMAGLGRSVLEMTARYVKERRQFGVPIGSFQAVQHHLADMAVSVRRVEHLARQAAWSVASERPEAARQVSRAKHAASELIPGVCWTAHQCHGAIGFTWEHNLHLYTRNAISWAAEFGDANFHAYKLADTLEV